MVDTITNFFMVTEDISHHYFIMKCL